MKQNSKIGLFGGSFDPVHNGHIELAKAALKELKLDKVIFIPAKKPPHKIGKNLSPATTRLKMLSLALRPFKKFVISRYELDKAPVTYTYQTVSRFKKLYPGSKLFFIIGTDSLIELITWKNIEKLINEISFVSGKRRGAKVSSRTPFLSSIGLLKSFIPPVSSSQIRALASAGRRFGGLVPGPVEKVILKEGLYR